MDLDEAFDRWVMAVKTQHGIIKYAEAMAQVLAEAGRASNKAMGDSAEAAVRKWSKVIEDRALEILREESRPQKSSLLLENKTDA